MRVQGRNVCVRGPNVRVRGSKCMFEDLMCIFKDLMACLRTLFKCSKKNSVILTNSVQAYHIAMFYRTNANIDLIISGVALLRELGVKETGIGKDCSEISTLDVLGECFSYFMAKGAAAERPITTHELNSEIVAATTRLANSQVGYRVYRMLGFQNFLKPWKGFPLSSTVYCCTPTFLVSMCNFPSELSVQVISHVYVL